MSDAPTVHVVDDEPLVLQSLGVLLKARGYRVESFSTAENFLRSADLLGQGCVVTDLRMPGMDGMELQERLSACGSSLAVIIASGHVDGPTMEYLLERGAVAVLEKPYAWEAMIAAVDRALALSREACRSLRGVEGTS